MKIGYFRTDADLLYHDEIHGDLFTQVDKTTDLLLTKYLRAGITYQGLQRIETFPVPDAALREAVLNAVIHKDYARGTPIQISVYPNKLMLWNPGHLPEDWSIAKLEGKHPSVPPNPDIANAFFRAGMIEAWGRGIQKIKDACRAEGAPMPLLRLDDGLWIEFTFAVESGTADALPTPVETRVQTRVETRVQKSRASTESALIGILREQPTATLAEAAATLGRAVSTVERASAKLIAAGRLRFVGPKKSGRWEILS